MREQHIRTCQAVADVGSLTKAAAATGTTHSSLSRHVAALQQELSAVLFERSPDGARLTAAGRAYRERIPPIEQALAAAVSAGCRDCRGG